MMRLHKKNVLILVCMLGFIWIMNLTLTTYSPETRPSNQLKEEIVRLSESYVRQLARETENTVDGPFAARFTGYDLKKTLAVILEDMMGRIKTLESEVNDLKKNSTEKRLFVRESRDAPLEGVIPPMRIDFDQQKPNPIDMRRLILGAQDDCSLTNTQQQQYPNCEAKMSWMRSHWQVDKCYAEYGVDGTDCTIRVYLSEVENWCPLIEGRTLPQRNNTVISEKAEMRFNLNGLLKKLENPGDRPNYDWIRERIRRMWPSWQVAGKSLMQKLNNNTDDRPKRKVLIHLGLLSKKSGFKMAENSNKGGPLGEMVQWSDIMCSLYMLGHDLTITSEFEELAGKLERLPTAQSQCQNRQQLPMDMIFSDIVGLTQFKRKVRAGYGKFSCLLRIIDSFGTEPAFNYEPFAKANRLKTQWGMQNLNPQQFFTMFPHSPDNSFMGFVVESHLNDTELDISVERKNQAVVYGKSESFWGGKDDYISVFREFVEIHATVYSGELGQALIPRYVHNHGIMSGSQLHQLLRESKIFIGLGFPYEGPAPLEAISLGNVFINPRFNPPHNGQNTKFFSDKPTRRKLTSQHPYVEDFIGEPHVITVDVDNKDELRQAIKKALNDIDSNKVDPYMPFEFTQEGMLQRVSYYITNQDFCQQNTEPWVPKHAVAYLASKPGESCKDACFREGRICEPSHFKKLNSAEMLEKVLGVSCELTIQHDHMLYPAYRSDTAQCVLQKEHMLFSCVGEDAIFTRLCPCRTYIPEQTAICEGCIS